MLLLVVCLAMLAICLAMLAIFLSLMLLLSRVNTLWYSGGYAFFLPRVAPRGAQVSSSVKRGRGVVR